MRINKAAIAYGLVTCCVSIASSVCAHYLPDVIWPITTGAITFLGSLIASVSIELMTEIEE